MLSLFFKLLLVSRKRLDYIGCEAIAMASSQLDHLAGQYEQIGEKYGADLKGKQAIVTGSNTVRRAQHADSK